MLDVSLTFPTLGRRPTIWGGGVSIRLLDISTMKGNVNLGGFLTSKRIKTDEITINISPTVFCSSYCRKEAIHIVGNQGSWVSRLD